MTNPCLFAIALAACASPPPPAPAGPEEPDVSGVAPTGGHAAPAPPAVAAPTGPAVDVVERAVRAGAVRLYDRETARRLETFDPRDAAGAAGFRVELEAGPKGAAWSGVVGRAPLAGCCLEPDHAAKPVRTSPGAWRITAAGDGSFYRCDDDGAAVDLELRLTSDGSYRATCGATEVVLVAGRSVKEAWAAWEKRTIDELYTAASQSNRRLAKTGDTWAFEQQPVGRCTVLARGCDQRELVASCHIQGVGVVRAHAGRVVLAPGNTPTSNTAACVKGALPGVEL